ncbi:hypothetical protein AAK967_05585 [Atopobiaceae bacterium 24-176]
MEYRATYPSPFGTRASAVAVGRAVGVYGSRATGSTTLVEPEGAGHGFTRRHDRGAVEALKAFAPLCPTSQRR